MRGGLFRHPLAENMFCMHRESTDSVQRLLNQPWRPPALSAAQSQDLVLPSVPAAMAAQLRHQQLMRVTPNPLALTMHEPQKRLAAAAAGQGAANMSALAALLRANHGAAQAMTCPTVQNSKGLAALLCVTVQSAAAAAVTALMTEVAMA